MLEDLNLNETRYTLPCLAIERVREHPDATDEDVELMRQYLADANWGAKRLVTALKKKGIKLHTDSIIRHREKRCPCWKT